MSAPRRLKDDPEFVADLGRALEDEQLVVGNYDLQGLRGRVTGGAPAPAGPSWWRIAVVSGVSASIVTFALMQLQPAPMAPVSPSFTPDIEVLAPPADAAPRSESELPEADGDALDGSADAVQVPPTPPIVAPRPSRPEPVTEAPPLPEAGSEETPPEGDSSALVAELADYNSAVELNDAQRWTDAHAAWSMYLDRWPNGRLRTEARLGMLGALVNADRPADVERLASELLATPDLGAHRDDLRIVRAEALVQLNRCPEALTVLEGARRNARVNAVRAACRKAGQTP